MQLVILDKKGIEGFPLRTVIISVILLISLSLSIYIIDAFNYFKDAENLRNSVRDIKYSMDSLKNGNEPGSWKEVMVNIPAESSIYVNESSNCLEIRGFGLNETCVDYDINNSLNINSGRYRVKIYYGENPEPENLTIVFE